MTVTLTHIREGALVTNDTRFFQFPGGEWDLAPDADPAAAGDAPFAATVVNDGAPERDLIQLALWADYCRDRGADVIVNLGYLPAARADKGTRAARAYARQINSLGADRLTAIDPHSPYLPGLLTNLHLVSLARVAARALPRALPRERRYDGIIAPDAGAAARAATLGAVLHAPVFAATKRRDQQTGRIVAYDAPDLDPAGTYLVADDICDGGATFRLLAEGIGIPRERLDLWVTHGLFTGRAPSLAAHFGRIITTDSCAPRNPLATHTEPLAPFYAPLFTDRYQA
ncbi:ribose-phosphate pyrophosphokinase [Micrococcales bacterium 31B]|nr:ribose-phosphate pyrophosphokinase [Micrococcales bacterium 31B]